jgi:hypothetical protein
MLANPLNVTLLSSQLITSPAIWDNRASLQTGRRILGVFSAAATAILQNDTADQPRTPYTRRRGLEREAWVKAVVNGADEKSPRWRHLPLLGGILLGFETQNRQGLPPQIRRKLESALAKAVQLSLEETKAFDGIAAHCITMVLNYTFEFLSDWERSQFDYSRLLPIMVHAAFFSSEGLEGIYFLGAIDREIVEVPGKKFNWSSHSYSYNHLQSIASRPLVSSLGSLSRLIAHALENVSDADLVLNTVNSVSDFVRTLMVQWRQNKLSEVDPSEEADFLDAESLKTTIPELWKLLRSCMFSVIIILRAVLGRVLNDPVLAAGRSAPSLSMQILQILRNLSFISFRIGQDASSQYVFVNLTAIDILAQYPDLAENFVRTIKPSELGQIPEHPLERCLDLFFLNTVEHFTLVLSPESNDELVISAALPYLASGGDNKLLEIFEAAHSVVLSVFAAPLNAEITAKYLPFYIDNLFMVFPRNLSARQFCLAIRSVVQITTPPSPLANSHPLLASIILELVHDRACQASSAALPPPPQSQGAADVVVDPPLSEQAVLILALIDSIFFLRVEDLEEWLPLAAKLISMVQNAEMRAVCIQRLWDALSSGEMNHENAHFCVTWWSTRGGRELVLFDTETESSNDPHMSGAIETTGRQNKL